MRRASSPRPTIAQAREEEDGPNGGYEERVDWLGTPPVARLLGAKMLDEGNDLAVRYVSEPPDGVLA